MDIDLYSKFPEMTPISSSPSYGTVNGIGKTLFGARDYDEETHSQVRTLCLCFFFLPLWALGAYRVKDSPHGWVFLGRVPLSGFARLLNFLVITAIIAGGGAFAWYQHVNSPEHIARVELARAEELIAEGNVKEAANIYRKVALGTTNVTGNAREGLQKLIHKHLASATPKEATYVLDIGLELKIQGSLQRGLALARNHKENHPDGALEILDLIQPEAYGEEGKIILNQRQEILERIVQKDPKDRDYVEQLALVYERIGKMDRCRVLLEKLGDEIGTGEGSRILGQIYLRLGMPEKALALLQPFVEENLEDHKKVYQQFQNLLQTKGESPRDKQEIREVYSKVQRGSSVVAAALDVGILLLRRAETKANPAERNKDLEEAEKTFLSVGSIAGQKIEYRLNLCQVYYWLGKEEKAKKLISDLIDEGKGNTYVLLAVSRVYRQIGERVKARKLAEQAYNQATDPVAKKNAALQRGLLYKDLDDRLSWLKRCDLTNPGLKAEYLAAKGHKALVQGKNKDAENEFQNAIQLYDSLPKSSSNLNNIGLLYLSLYSANGNPAVLTKGIENLEKATELNPRNSVLLKNAAENIFITAIRDIITDQIQLEQIGFRPGYTQINYLYDNAQGKEQLYKKLRNHIGIKKARSYFERLQVISPKSREVYQYLFVLYIIQDDQKAMIDMLARVKNIELPLSFYDQNVLERILKGKEDSYFDVLTGLEKRSLEGYEKAKKIGGRTLALAAGTVVQNRLDLAAWFGVKQDADELIRLSQEAHKAFPSSGTRSKLIKSYLFRAAESLRKTHPELNSLIEKHRRSLPISYLMAFTLEKGQNLSQEIKDHPDIKKAVGYLKETEKRFSDSPHIFRWAIYKNTDPELAAKVADKLREDTKQQRLLALELEILAIDSAIALESYWFGKLTGNQQPAIEYGKKIASKGIPVPFLNN